MVEVSRVCHDCHLERPSSEFVKSQECVGGLGWQCRACRAIRWQKYAEQLRAKRAAQPKRTPPPGNWKDVHGGHYAVSDEGQVWTYRYGRLLAGTLSRDGYRKVLIKGRSTFVHRLVAEAFVHGEGEQVRHKDGVKLNNAAVNLEWGTCQENILDKWKHGKMVVGERHHCNKIPEAEIPAIRASHESNTELGRRYGVSRTAIYAIRKGKSYGWL